MTEHAVVVRDEHGLLAGLAELDAIEERIADRGVHPDIPPIPAEIADMMLQVSVIGKLVE